MKKQNSDHIFDPAIEREAKIKAENARLRRRYEVLPEDSMDILDGLIDRAAFLRVYIDEMEEDILLNGTTAPFTQSERLDPYDRERPVVRQHVQYINAYQKIIKQLDDKLPKVEATEKDDGFDAFVSLRR